MPKQERLKCNLALRSQVRLDWELVLPDSMRSKEVVMQLKMSDFAKSNSWYIIIKQVHTGKIEKGQWAGGSVEDEQKIICMLKITSTVGQECSPGGRQGESTPNGPGCSSQKYSSRTKFHRLMKKNPSVVTWTCTVWLQWNWKNGIYWWFATDGCDRMCAEVNRSLWAQIHMETQDDTWWYIDRIYWCKPASKIALDTCNVHYLTSTWMCWSSNSSFILKSNQTIIW